MGIKPNTITLSSNHIWCEDCTAHIISIHLMCSSYIESYIHCVCITSDVEKRNKKRSHRVHTHIALADSSRVVLIFCRTLSQSLNKFKFQFIIYWKFCLRWRLCNFPITESIYVKHRVGLVFCALPQVHKRLTGRNCLTYFAIVKIA